MLTLFLSGEALLYPEDCLRLFQDIRNETDQLVRTTVKLFNDEVGLILCDIVLAECTAGTAHTEASQDNRIISN